MLPVEATELPCDQQSLAALIFFILVSIFFNTDSTVSAAKAVVTASQSTELISSSAFVIAGLKAKASLQRPFHLALTMFLPKNRNASTVCNQLNLKIHPSIPKALSPALPHTVNTEICFDSPDRQAKTDRPYPTSFFTSARLKFTLSLKAPLLPTEAIELPCDQQSLAVLIFFILVGIFFNTDDAASAAKVVVTDSQSTELISPLAFMLAGLKAKALYASTLIPGCAPLMQKALLTTPPAIGKLLASTNYHPLIEPLAVWPAFPGYPVSASSIPEDLSPEEHEELVDHIHEMNFPIPEEPLTDLDGSTIEPVAQDLSQQVEPIQQLAPELTQVVERVFTLPDLLNSNLLPGFGLLRKQSTSGLCDRDFWNPVFDLNIHEGLLHFYANDIGLPLPVVAAFVLYNGFISIQPVLCQLVHVERLLTRACSNAVSALLSSIRRVYSRVEQLEYMCLQVRRAPNTIIMHRLVY